MNLTVEEREQAARDLEAGREVLAGGWIRGAMHSPAGRCLIGAVSWGLRDELHRCAAAQAVLDTYLRQAYPDMVCYADGMMISYVNDHVLRDRQDAMDVLAKAAAAAREGVG